MPTLVVPEIRDYTRINADLAALLDAGHPRVRLLGVDGQRLLAFGLRGGWKAVVEIQGDAGPELGAEIDAPGLVVACSGSARDGAGRGLISGRLLIAGDAGPAVGYAQRGGTIAVAGSCGPRAGLDQRGGLLILGGPVGRLSGERQSGGRLLALRGPLGPHPGVGRRGGRFAGPMEIDREDRDILAAESSACGWAWPFGLRDA